MVQEIDLKKLESISSSKTDLPNIDQLIKFGIVEKEIEPVAGWKITMHALTQEEREQVCKMVPDTEATTLTAKGEYIKRPTLAWAITKINDEIFQTPEQKQILFNKLKEAPGTTIDLLYIAYQNIFMEQFDLLQTGIKKKL